MADIFISYRREDRPGYAGWLYQFLDGKFPNEVFMDLSGIADGEDFEDRIAWEIDSCRVLLAVIGPEWLRCADGAGRRKVDDPNDFVVREVCGALSRNVRVIPVLVDQAELPKPGELPGERSSIREVVRRQARTLTHDRFQEDCAHLVEQVRKVLAEMKEQDRHRHERLEESKKEFARFVEDYRTADRRDRLRLDSQLRRGVARLPLDEMLRLMGEDANDKHLAKALASSLAHRRDDDDPDKVLDLLENLADSPSSRARYRTAGVAGVRGRVPAGKPRERLRRIVEDWKRREGNPKVQRQLEVAESVLSDRH